MNETTIPYEESIDLKGLCVYILRKWRGFLLATAVGAIVLGGYKAVSGPMVITDSVRVTEIEMLVKENEIKLQSLQGELAEMLVFQDSVSGLEYEIQTKENKIRTQIIVLENLSKVIDTYKVSLQEVQNLAENVVHAEVLAEIVSTMSTLQMDILNSTNEMLAVRQEIANLEEEVAILEKYLVEAEKLQDAIDVIEEQNEKLAKEDTKVTIHVSIVDIIKFAVIGAILGGFAACGVAFLQYFVNKKLHDVEDLKERYDVRILGDFYVPSAKKNKLDQLLDRMEGFGKAKDIEKEAALVAAKVQVLAPVDAEKQQIIVTGTVDSAMLKAATQQIRENLPAAEYEICVVQNPVYDAEALLKIRQGIVVLVEARDVSVKKEIAALVDLLSTAKAKVLGVVLR